MQEECSWCRQPLSRKTSDNIGNILSCIYSSVQEGTWTESHSFRYAGQLFEREKGAKVGNIMLPWRQLRASQPAMLRQGVLIWQSPTAYVDGVLWAWQQDLEGSSFEPLLRLVDALSTHWSEAAGERGFMLQQVQASIPAGCTPVLQVTDTAMAQPAKSAARSEHERQKRLFLLKAGQEKVRPSFKYGAREMLQVAIVMHKKMEQLAEERNTVLSEARAWLAVGCTGGQVCQARVCSLQVSRSGQLA